MARRPDKPDTKKQHTVPQFYLKGFGDAGDRLFVYDKVTAKVFRSRVQDVAEQHRFYDLPPECFDLEADAPYDPQFVEHILGQHETVLGKAMAEFLAQAEKEQPIDLNHRCALACFMALQALRTPLLRQAMVEARTRLIEHLLSTEGPECLAPGTPLYNQLNVPEYGYAESQARLLLDPMMSAQAMAPLIQHIWRVGVNKTGTPLYTSDNPVVRYPHIEPPPGMGFGTGSIGVEVALPLSPEILLSLIDRRAFSNEADQDGKRQLMDKTEVVFYNGLQVSHSERQLYCSASDFALAEQLCRERPHLRDPKRQRIWVN